ncbi:MAG TPA: FecR domain-containing protein [Steroidobacteraceae bacterium]|nr:FecR domain-containing protein [Steroidobacteraceae bacterium]
MDANDRRRRAGSEAADWFSRLQAGTMERAEREQFVEWLRESHIHVAEMLRIAQINGALAHFAGWARIATGPKTDADDVIQLPPLGNSTSPSPESPLQGPPPRASRVGHGLRLFAFAATVALIVATALVLPQLRGQLIQTERGERRDVVLADGSQLQVDPETLLRVKYTDSARRVLLERGRALFHVAKSPDRPFTVQVGDTEVRAIGTVFGVEQRGHGVVITVAEGKVAVRPPESSSPESPPNASTRGQAESRSSQLLLTANQQVTVASTVGRESIREVDSQRALAWAQGRLIFQNDDVQQALEEFNRYNRVKLSVVDSELAAKPVSGVFNAADPEAFIAFLQSVTPLIVERDGDRSITISTRRSPDGDRY